jgi:hypothetical protein
MGIKADVHHDSFRNHLNEFNSRSNFLLCSNYCEQPNILIGSIQEITARPFSLILCNALCRVDLDLYPFAEDLDRFAWPGTSLGSDCN